MPSSDLSLAAQAALGVCKSLLGSLRTQDEDFFTSTLYPSGHTVLARHQHRDTILFHNMYGELQEYLKSIWNSDVVNEEVIDESRETVVLVHHDLAAVWTPYWFRKDGKLRNSF